jgi:hypothetical protein
MIPLSPLGLLITQAISWARGDEVGNTALSLGERVASGASQVRGYLFVLAYVFPSRHATDPSPGPRRLVKAPVAVHPLPQGEGKDSCVMHSVSDLTDSDLRRSSFRMTVRSSFGIRIDSSSKLKRRS